MPQITRGATSSAILKRGDTWGLLAKDAARTLGEAGKFQGEWDDDGGTRWELDGRMTVTIRCLSSTQISLSLPLTHVRTADSPEPKHQKA